MPTEGIPHMTTPSHASSRLAGLSGLELQTPDSPMPAFRDMTPVTTPKFPSPTAQVGLKDYL